MSKTAHPLDSDTETPRRFVGDTLTRLIHRTDSQDEACAIDLGDEERTRHLVYSDDYKRLSGQEWTAYETYRGPIPEGETPEMYGLPPGTTEKNRKREVMRTFRACSICRPDAKETRHDDDD